MGPERLFAYGTLNDATKQEELFGRVIAGTEDVLDDYGRIEIVEDVVAYLAAVPAGGVSIPGRVLELTDEDLKAADTWEGDAYRRETLKLRSGASAWVYLKK